MVTDAYLEVGSKRTFAGALDWPGWCRAGRDEAAALEALITYGSRYAAVVEGTGLAVPTPAGPGDVRVVGRLAGNATTDFGAPDRAAPGDEAPLDARALTRLTTILRACWAALDAAADAASGAELARGPRGGGRDVTAILAHVADAEGGYLSRLAWRAPADRMARRQAVLEALAAAAPIGQLPPGPRGGARWPARFFVRRVAWHAVDHAWEIEDRTPPGP